MVTKKFVVLLVVLLVVILILINDALLIGGYFYLNPPTNEDVSSEVEDEDDAKSEADEHYISIDECIGGKYHVRGYRIVGTDNDGGYTSQVPCDCENKVSDEEEVKE